MCCDGVLVDGPPSVVSNRGLFDGTGFSGLVMADTRAKLSIQLCRSYMCYLSLAGLLGKHPNALT